MCENENLEMTILELTDDEYQVLRDVLESAILKKSKTAYGEANVQSVLYLLEEAFNTTEDYRKAEDEDYVTLANQSKQRLKEYLEKPQVDVYS